jgi:ankyrin repeat protein
MKRNREHEYLEHIKSLTGTLKEAQKNEALFCSCKEGDEDIAKLMLHKGADPNKRMRNGATPLCTAIDNGHSGIVKLLIENGADINQPDGKDRTPLNSAAENGRLKIAKLLIEKEADINQQDDEGWTPLYSSILRGKLKIAKLLIENGSDLDKSDNDGCTPLCVAAAEGHSEIAKLLIEKGSNINKEDGEWSALFFAVNGGHLEIIQLLVENGADISKTDINGCTAFDNAVGCGKYKIVKLFIKSDLDRKYLQGSKLRFLLFEDDDFFVSQASKRIKQLVDIILSGWTIENHKYFSTVNQQKIETLVKLHSFSWISKIPKSLIFSICKAMTLQ